MNVKLTCIDSTPDTTDTQHTWRKPRTAPSRCNLCNAKLDSFYVQGMTRHGLAKTMCVTCHREHGIGLGSGHGVIYSVNTDGTFARMWGG